MGKHDRHGNSSPRDGQDNREDFEDIQDEMYEEEEGDEQAGDGYGDAEDEESPGTGLGKEIKIGLAVIVGLLVVLGTVLVVKFRGGSDTSKAVAEGESDGATDPATKGEGSSPADLLKSPPAVNVKASKPLPSSKGKADDDDGFVTMKDPVGAKSGSGSKSSGLSRSFMDPPEKSPKEAKRTASPWGRDADEADSPVASTIGRNKPAKPDTEEELFPRAQRPSAQQPVGSKTASSNRTAPGGASLRNDAKTTEAADSSRSLVQKTSTRDWGSDVGSARRADSGLTTSSDRNSRTSIGGPADRSVIPSSGIDEDGRGTVADQTAPRSQSLVTKPGKSDMGSQRDLGGLGNVGSEPLGGSQNSPAGRAESTQFPTQSQTNPIRSNQDAGRTPVGSTNRQRMPDASAGSMAGSGQTIDGFPDASATVDPFAGRSQQPPATSPQTSGLGGLTARGSSGLSRRDDLDSGTTLVSSPSRAAGRRVYVVQDGETMYDIARRELGKASRWAEIYELNRDAIGKQFDYLTPGTQLVLPDAASGPGAMTRRASNDINR